MIMTAFERMSMPGSARDNCNCDLTVSGASKDHVICPAWCNDLTSSKLAAVAMACVSGSAAEDAC